MFRELHYGVMYRSKPALFVALIILAGIVVLFVPRGTTAEQPAQFAGTLLHGARAPEIAGHDQFGRKFDLASFRGRPVVITFLEAHCTELCPLVTDKIRRAVTALRAAGKNAAVIAVSTDPEGDTPREVAQFSSQHRMMHLWHYLTGSRAHLGRIWHGYYIYVPPPNAPAAIRDNHTSATFILDRHGREQVLMSGDPNEAGLLSDLRMLSGLAPLPSRWLQTPAPQVDHPAPDFALRRPDGSEISLKSLRGKVVLLNFWATWCHPCQTEIPRLSAWYRQYHSHGLVILGVDKQEDAQHVRSYIRTHHVPYPVVIDPKGDVTSLYELAWIPDSVIIDPGGTIRAITTGMVDASYWRKHVGSLLAHPVS